MGLLRVRTVYEWPAHAPPPPAPTNGVIPRRDARSLWAGSLRFDLESDYAPANGRRAWIARGAGTPAPAAHLAVALGALRAADPRAALLVEDGAAERVDGLVTLGELVELPVGAPFFMPHAARGVRPGRQLVKRALERALPARLMITDGPRRDSVYLTFDDGPHPTHTPVLLDVLRDAGVRATFFVIGEQAAKHPAVVRRMVADGHAVGSHSWSHTPAHETSSAQLADEVTRTARLLGTLGGKARLFRPPYGAVSAGKLGRLWAARQQVVLWNLDPRDYALEDADELAQWFSLRPLRGGDVVLLHDTVAHAAGALPAAIAAARGAGLAFATL